MPPRANRSGQKGRPIRRASYLADVQGLYEFPYADEETKRA